MFQLSGFYFRALGLEVTGFAAVRLWCLTWSFGCSGSLGGGGRNPAERRALKP